jgi:cephalosporin-C deacetylase-like acetyl esterase
MGGDTGNHAAYSTGMETNVVTKGIPDKNEFYYRAVYMDCVKAIDFLECCSEIDHARIITAPPHTHGIIWISLPHGWNSGCNANRYKRKTV